MGTSDLVDSLQRRYVRYFAARPALPFAVTTNGGPAHRFGSGDPLFTISVADPRGAKALADLDQFGVAVAYLQGWLDVEGDLASALKMRAFFSDFHPVAWLGRFLPAVVRGGRQEDDRRTISHHYDEDSEFFLTFLDTRHRCYTEGVFLSDDEPLEDAMTRKMDLALDAIGVRPGDHVLEVGGGWGAFAEHAARRGINVTTTTLSKESERYLTEFFDREQLPVRVIRKHIFGYTPDRRYDAIVNMGVTEHLPDYRTTLRKYAEVLRPGGRVYLDALAMRRKHAASTFMKRYIYPGASAPLLLHQYLHQVARSPFELLSLADDRHNYYLTCREWARRLDAAREEIVARWGEPLYRRFRLFLWGSAAGFDTGLVQAYRWTLRLP
ncbi:class I SAM-dependent methyltransferase [Micromonospora polyrhachis]|uniref:Cyclopropane-fatty-acyl-phospholipid synthase n=1 Tax=Micromonospora polyrhachis TaxID=1282883 RepID=A0A7W7WS40_9ACTN|nr:class I SAM-dependent methyltransferase [Micromonospora polyrhachis]MBB4961594.1 cyclopropane-fatty-acyl-phospholipid synthase [Micromonospora polyrhachis]